MIKCDLLVVTAPYTQTNYPLQAPAIIKASAIKNGFTANTYDINNEFLKLENTDNETFQLLKNFWSYGTIDDTSRMNVAENYVKTTAEKILQKYIV